MEIISNMEGVPGIFSRLFDAFDEKLLLFNKAAFLEKMELFIIVGNDNDAMKKIVDHACAMESGDDFITIIKESFRGTDDFFVSCITGETGIDFVYMTVLGLKGKKNVHGNMTFSIGYAIFQFIELFMDIGVLGGNVTDLEKKYLMDDIVDYMVHVSPELSTGN